jgi:hypothetical protein
MSTSRVYCLLITHDNTVDGQGFRVDVDPNDDVMEFKNKVVIAVPEAVVGYSPRILQVYRCPKTIFDDTDPQKLQEQVNQAMSLGGNARLHHKGDCFHTPDERDAAREDPWYVLIFFQ